MVLCARENYDMWHENMSQLLIDEGADVNIKNYEGETALMITITCNNPVELLINANSDINTKDNERDTPLTNALTQTTIVNQETVELLIDSKADLYTKNYNDKNAMDYLQEYLPRLYRYLVNKEKP